VKGILQEIRSRLPSQVRKSLDMQTGGLILVMPESSKTVFRATASAAHRAKLTRALKKKAKAKETERADEGATGLSGWDEFGIDGLLRQCQRAVPLVEVPSFHRQRIDRQIPHKDVPGPWS
jgi:hypothetical protein